MGIQVVQEIGHADATATRITTHVMKKEIECVLSHPGAMVEEKKGE